MVRVGGGGGAHRCPPKVPLLFGRKRTSRVMGDREIFQEEGGKTAKIRFICFVHE